MVAHKSCQKLNVMFTNSFVATSFIYSYEGKYAYNLQLRRGQNMEAC